MELALTAFFLQTLVVFSTTYLYLKLSPKSCEKKT